MRDHLEDNWGFYAVGLVTVAFIWLLVVSVNQNNERQAYCYDRGAVLVDTDAGPRCAYVEALERVR